MNEAKEDYELYDTVPQPQPGRNPAVPNVALEVALMNMAIGHSKARQLLSAIDLDPPASSGMHVTSRKVGEKIVQLNEADMKGKLLEAAGPEKTIHIGSYSKYNNTRRCVSRRTGCSTATQMTTLAIELKSGKKHIVAASSRSPACHLGALARNRDPPVTCPNHPGCTADNRDPPVTCPNHPGCTADNRDPTVTCPNHPGCTADNRDPTVTCPNHPGCTADNRDPPVTCPNHPGCTADNRDPPVTFTLGVQHTDRLQGFSEYQAGHDVASTTASARVNIVRCTTDGDVRLMKGIADGMAQADD
ncbi:hypothetical protein ACOMHN_063188 [Nucella lapillus]